MSTIQAVPDYLPAPKDRDYVQALSGPHADGATRACWRTATGFRPCSPQLELHSKRSDYNCPPLDKIASQGIDPWLTTLGNQEDERRCFLDKGSFVHLKTGIAGQPCSVKNLARMYECDLAELQQFLPGHCPPPAVFKTAMREKRRMCRWAWVLHAKSQSSGPFADLDAISGSAEPYCSLSHLETQPVQPQTPFITLMSDQFSALFGDRA